ncbi:MAG: serine hydrolase [Tissierellia bacterium]|nr:serine hydrolase [Tissierellia bacterium]
MDELKNLLEERPGRYSLYFENLLNGNTWGHGEDEIHLAASTIKVPILCALYVKGAEGLDLSERVDIPRGALVGGSGILDQLSAGFRPSLEDLALLMTVLSDNTATNLLAEVLGIGAVQSFISSMGMERTQFQRKMMDEEARSRGLENTTTARDMGRLLRALALGKVHSSGLSQRVVDLLLRQQSVGKLPHLIPSVAFDEVKELHEVPRGQVAVAHKSGELEESEHDVGIFYTHLGPSYTLSVFSSELPHRLAGRRTVAEASRLVYYGFLRGLL